MVTQFCWISVIFVDLGGLYKISTIWWILQDPARRGPARRLKIEDSTHVIPHADVPSVWRIRVRLWWVLRCMCVCVFMSSGSASCILAGPNSRPSVRSLGVTAKKNKKFKKG